MYTRLSRTLNTCQVVVGSVRCYVRVVPRVQEDVFCADDRNRRLGCDDTGEFDRRRDDLVAAPGDDATDEADLLRLVGVEGTRGEGELACQTLVADDLGEACQRADIRGESDINFLRKMSVKGSLRAETRRGKDRICAAVPEGHCTNRLGTGKRKVTSGEIISAVPNLEPELQNRGTRSTPEVTEGTSPDITRSGDIP